MCIRDSVVRELPSALLVVAGLGPARAELQRVAVALGLDSQILWLGYLDRERELADCYRAGDAFVFTSKTETQGLVLLEAMALGIARAQTHGSCIVALGNSHHLGRIGAWAEQVAEAGLVSMHFVNVISRPFVAPFGGADARFGTNPFCAGVPLPGRPPVILDFATSVIAQGKTRVAFNKGESVAPGCLIDGHGQPTQDPGCMFVPPLGALLTFGGHKGYGLAAMCELLGGALAAGMTQRVPEGDKMRILNGMFSVLVDPDALVPELVPAGSLVTISRDLLVAIAPLAR